MTQRLDLESPCDFNVQGLKYDQTGIGRSIIQIQGIRSYEAIKANINRLCIIYSKFSRKEKYLTDSVGPLKIGNWKLL